MLQQKHNSLIHLVDMIIAMALTTSVQGLQATRPLIREAVCRVNKYTPALVRNGNIEGRYSVRATGEDLTGFIVEGSTEAFHTQEYIL